MIRKRIAKTKAKTTDNALLCLSQTSDGSHHQGSEEHRPGSRGVGTGVLAVRPGAQFGRCAVLAERSCRRVVHTTESRGGRPPGVVSDCISHATGPRRMSRARLFWAWVIGEEVRRVAPSLWKPARPSSEYLTWRQGAQHVACLPDVVINQLGCWPNYPTVYRGFRILQ